MPAHDRLRRRDEREGPQSPPATPARTPDAASILALQRTAGNRAVVQRLFYNENQKTLGLPASYADQRLPWDGERYLQSRAAQPTDPKLIDLVTQDAAVKEHLRKGMNLDELQSARSFPDATLQTNVGNLADANAPAAVGAELQAVAVDRNRLIRHWSNAKYSDLTELD